jgi:hypothetical protein
MGAADGTTTSYFLDSLPLNVDTQIPQFIPHNVMSSDTNFPFRMNNRVTKHHLNFSGLRLKNFTFLDFVLTSKNGGKSFNEIRNFVLPVELMLNMLR